MVGIDSVARCDVLVLSEINPDVVIRDRSPQPRFGQAEKIVENMSLAVGGSGTIFACGLARLGLNVSVVGRVGDDIFGEFMLCELRRRGVNIDGVTFSHDKSTGLSIILSGGDDRAIFTYPGAMEEMSVAHIDPELLVSSRHLHVPSYFLQTGLQKGLPDILKRFRKEGGTVSLDTNWDPTERWDSGVLDLLPHVDIFLPNENEAYALTGSTSLPDAIQKLSEYTAEVVVKRGKEGAEACVEGERVFVNAIPTQIVDTTGAGDSFDAGYVFAFLAGLCPHQRLRLANACGSISTLGDGGIQGQATLEQVREVMGNEG